MKPFWDDRSRAPLRVALGIVLLQDLVLLAGTLWLARPSELSHPRAPAWLIGIAGRPLPIVALSLIALVAVVQLMRGRRTLACGALALVAMALMAESHAAVVGGPARNTFASGAVLLGWLGGLVWGRALGDGDREDLAESGALALLAATYVGAALSKLMALGVAWIDDHTLRALLLTQNRVSDHGLLARYAMLVVEHPRLSQALAGATVVIQLGAVALVLSARLRLVSAALLLAFHVNVALLTGIYYSGNMLLLVAFGCPWARWLGLRRGDAPEHLRKPDVEHRVLIAGVAVVVVLIALAWLLPLRGYTLLHHRRT
jgi:hypothetical protein